jgi:hypothetical protein
MHGDNVPGSATPPPAIQPPRTEVIQPPAPPETAADTIRRLLTSGNPQAVQYGLRLYLAAATRQPREPPSGFRWSGDGTRLEVIPGGPGEQLSPDVAGRLAMLRTAAQDLPGAREFFTRNWSTSEAVRNMIGHPQFAEEYNRNRRSVQTAVEGIIRAVSGANAPEAEVQRLLNMYMPSNTDTIDVARQKLALLSRFMQEYESTVMRGRGGSGGSGQGWVDVAPNVRIRPLN